MSKKPEFKQEDLYLYIDIPQPPTLPQEIKSKQNDRGILIVDLTSDSESSSIVDFNIL
jgi:hypothetical protein